MSRIKRLVDRVQRASAIISPDANYSKSASTMASRKKGAARIRLQRKASGGKRGLRSIGMG